MLQKRFLDDANSLLNDALHKAHGDLDKTLRSELSKAVEANMVYGSHLDFAIRDKARDEVRHRAEIDRMLASGKIIDGKTMIGYLTWKRSARR